LTQQGSRVFNRLFYTNDAQGRFAARFMYNKLGLRKLAVMHDDGVYSQSVAEAVQSEFLALGGQVTALVVITPGQADYSTALSSIASTNPEALYYGGYPDEAATIVNQMDSAGLSNVIFVSDDAVFGQDFILRTGANGEGAYIASIIPHSSPALTAFNTAYEQRYDIAAGSLSPITWYSYDAAASLIYAIKKVAFLGPDGNLYVPRNALVSSVRALTNYQGISGVITCSTTGECNSTGPTFNVVQGGKWVEVP
jgi:branched-chain amino acid transport system substrate-binding protein